MNKRLLQVAAIIIFGGGAVYYLMNHQAAQPTPPASEDNSGAQTFSSDQLGITFKYHPDQDGDGQPDTAVKEAGDKVYVYYSAASPEDGQWVQEFHKDASDNLAAAVKKQFLLNYSEKDCYAQDLADYFRSFDVDPPKIRDNFSEVIISYPKPTDPEAPFFQNADKCPKTYTFTNGLSYFLMDKNHPDKFFFFSIGQYAILADPAKSVTWQDTFEVTK